LIVTALGVIPAAAQGPAPTQTSTRQTAITQDEIQLQGDTTPRGALPTVNGDTGIWFVPTAESLPAGKWSASVFRANWDQLQGLSDISKLGVTAAVGFSRGEVFGSWGIMRVKRDVTSPFFNSDPKFGGIADQVPFQRRSWSKNIGSPLEVGAKWSLLSQSRGDAMSLAPRVMFSLPIGPQWGWTDSLETTTSIVASREFGKSVEISGTTGTLLRHQPDEFHIPNKMIWGVGTTFPTRSPIRALVEYNGAYALGNEVLTVVPMIAEDGSLYPASGSLVRGPNNFKFGVVGQAKNGFFGRIGMNFTPGVSDRTVDGVAYEHSGWGLEASIGWHPGVTPARERVHVIKETTTVTNTITQPAPPAPAPNRNPTFSLNATCDPSSVDPGAVSRCNATATDPDGDAITYQWTAPSGTFGTANAASTTWTAGQNQGAVPLTVTARDTRGGSATSTVTVNVARRVEITFEDVHFDFDKFNLRPDALRILDDAVSKLMQNGNVRVTIEGHTDNVGTSEYNLALGERRANSVRDYLTNRGIQNTRLQTVSYGEDRPIGDNKTTAGRALNRRAHLVVIVENVP
jgi:peptidoglycan-associated lipoprotein